MKNKTEFYEHVKKYCSSETVDSVAVRLWESRRRAIAGHLHRNTIDAINSALRARFTEIDREEGRILL